MDELFKDGRRFNLSLFRVFYLPVVADEKLKRTGIQFGVGVSARNFKKAVDRNRIKRQVREAYRLQKNQLADMACTKNIHMAVFVIYTARELPLYSVVHEQLGKIVKKLSTIIDENIPANT
jgi:ribonuclease P protein component